MRSLSRLPCSYQNRVMSTRPGRVGGLPAADRADEGALDVERVGADGLGQDVGGQDVAFLEQVGVLLRGVVVARRRAGAGLGRGPVDGPGAAGDQRQRREHDDRDRRPGDASVARLIWRSRSTAGSVPWPRRTAGGNGFSAKLTDHSMKSSLNWMPISHRLSPRVGSVPTAMNPSWPSMLMSSTLVRDSSSVLRSRPIGLPRYQVKEKCGPRMPPPASHWHPTEFVGRLHQAGHPGLLGHRLIGDAAALREHRAVLGVGRLRGATAATGSGDGPLGVRDMRHRQNRRRPGRHGQFARRCHAHLLRVTACTVAAALEPTTDMPLDLPFCRDSRRCSPTRCCSPHGRCATVTRCSWRCCDSMSGRTGGWSRP